MPVSVSGGPDIADRRVGLWRQRLAAAAGAAVFAVMGLQLALTGIYADKIYPGVTVAGLQLGGLSRTQAKSFLAQKINGYQVRLMVDGKPVNISPGELGVRYDINATADQAYNLGRKQWFWPLALLQPEPDRSGGYAYSVNETAKDRFVSGIVRSAGQAPVDAAIIIQNGRPSVQSDKNGRSLSPAEVSAVISRQIEAASDTPAVLTLKVQPARIRAADVAPAVDLTEKLLATPISIIYQDKTFKPTPADMSGWIAYDKPAPGQPAGLIPKPNLDGIKFYLQSIAVQINKNPVNRKVRVENGVSSETQAGQDGLQLDQDALADKIAAALASRQPLTAEATTTPVPFKTEYNRVISLDYGKYIEVSLSRQRLWVYQDHNVIFESPLTSGATGAGFPTVTGLFSIQAKQTNRNLNGYAIGYNYNVFVKYWMPFYGNYGLHDASWRSSFGGPDYYYGGSHGCVNLPETTAAFIFNWSNIGTPVWVHN